MLIIAAAMAGASLGSCPIHFTSGRHADRPIATAPLYPSSMADDVHRPGFNGRLFVTRPIIGPGHGPYAVAEGSPGASHYGAFDQQDATVYVRVGHTAIGINAWERHGKRGLAHLENARQFWLYERGYTGGVRTFVNDTVTFGAPRERVVREASAAPAGPASTPSAREIRPRATITVPADVPRAKSRIRVRSAHTGATIAALPGDGPARVSLPGLPGAAARPSAAPDAARAPTVIVRAE
ncbi:MAG: hypothetical protein WD749_04440 [Phycisphaerales bacterium]